MSEAEYRVICVHCGREFITTTAFRNVCYRCDLSPMNETKDTALDKQVGGAHYKSYAIQPVEFCQRNGLKFCEANAIKYIVRHREKNGRQDIEKAIHYLELLLEIEYKEGTKE